MSKLELLRFALATGLHAMAVLALAVAAYLEASRRPKVAILWYVVCGCALAATLAYTYAHIDSGVSNAPFVFGRVDVRTTLAAGIWPVALWAVADALDIYRQPARYAGYWVALIIAVIERQMGRADLFQVLAGYALGALVSWLIIRMATNTDEGWRDPPQDER